MIFLYLSLLASIIDNFGVTFEGNDFKILTKCNEKLTEYTLPIETVQIKPGTEFVNAFGSCTILRTVRFPKNSELVSIGSFSFYRSNIESIDFSNCSRLKEIQNDAFLYCSNLFEVVFSNSITYLGPSCFMSTRIKSVVLPMNLTSLNYRTFYNCNSITNFTFQPDCFLSTINYESCKIGITSLTIPKSVTSLQNGFFGTPLNKIFVEEGNDKYVSIDNIVYTKDLKTIVMSPKNLESIKINENVTTIRNMAFRECIADTVDLGNVTSIESWAFGATRFSTVILPGTLRTVYYSFLAYSRVEYVDIEEGLKTIPSKAFSYCTNLKKVSLARSITTISTSAFEYCSSLQELFIPNTVQTIQSGALSKINLSCNITFESGSCFLNVNGFICTSNMKSALFYIGAKGGSVTVPDVECISVGLFYQMNFNEIIISSSITTVESEAFAETTINSVSFSNLRVIQSSGFCSSSISEIELGPKLEKIERDAFKSCKNLVSISFPSTLQQISSNAFEGCRKLERVKFATGCGVWTIGDFCFAGTYLDSITMPPNISSIGVYCFKNSLLTTLKFHTDSILTTIPNYSFSSASHIEEIEFPESVLNIGVSSFEGCNGLVSFKLPNSLINISSAAFRNCINLESITIPDRSHLQNIFGLAFEGCTRLARMDVSEKNEFFSYEDGVLYDREKTRIVVYLPASSRTVFSIKESVRNIGPYSFYACYNLLNVSVPNGITSIGFQAFKDCIKLEFLVLPSTLKEVFGQAFEGCNNLKRCGSVIYDRETQKELLLKSGIESSALEECSTSIFTAKKEDDVSILFLSITSTEIDRE